MTSTHVNRQELSARLVHRTTRSEAGRTLGPRCSARDDLPRAERALLASRATLAERTEACGMRRSVRDEYRAERTLRSVPTSSAGVAHRSEQVRRRMPFGVGPVSHPVGGRMEVNRDPIWHRRRATKLLNDLFSREALRRECPTYRFIVGVCFSG
jgi:hypothetical protein